MVGNNGSARKSNFSTFLFFVNAFMSVVCIAKTDEKISSNYSLYY